MRTLLIIFAASILLNTSVSGQDYFPFPTQNASWNIYLETTCENDSPPDTFLMRYVIQGDTTINEKDYCRIVVEKGDTVNPSVEPVGGIREEGKKVYYFGKGFLGNETEEEILLYDFNVHINDTVNHSSNGFWKSIVLDIDSILVGNKYRKRYQVDNGWYYHTPDYIIEGIGSVINGLLGHISDIPTCGTHYWENVCFCENGQVVYQNPSYKDCFAGVNLSSSEMIESQKFRIFPNPFTNSIQIDNIKGEKLLSVEIYNSLGKMIFEELVNKETCQISITGAVGIYIVVVKGLNGKVLLKEIIVKE